MTQLRLDVDFLRHVETIDYSFLCGVHFPQRDGRICDNRSSGKPPDAALVRNARSAPWEDSGDSGLEGTMPPGKEPESYFFGIIDVLTPYGPIKRAEFGVKALTQPTRWRGVSCCSPDRYASRFERAMKDWID